jgi:hypothetical protein
VTTALLTMARSGRGSSDYGYTYYGSCPIEQAGRVNGLIDRAEAALAGKRWDEAKVACAASLPLLPTGAQHHRKRAAVLLRLGVATASLGDVGASR